MPSDQCSHLAVEAYALASLAVRRPKAFENAVPHPPSEGDAIRYRITNHDGQTFEFEKYYLRPATYEAAARDAGFPDFRWVSSDIRN